MIKDLKNFYIDAKTKIFIDLNLLLTEILCCSEASIFFEHNATLIISSDELYASMQKMHYTFNEARQQKLFLHSSLKNDLGYLYNIYIFNFKSGIFYDKTQFISVQWGENKHWVGIKHQLWDDYYTTWVYNDATGNIIFEITPKYPGFYNNKPLEEQEFTQWLTTTYKPYYKTTISLHTVTQWLQQTKEILAIIESNIARMQDEHDTQE